MAVKVPTCCGCGSDVLSCTTHDNTEAIAKYYEDVKVFEASKETIAVVCLECGERFETVVDMHTEEIECKNCGSTDIEVD